MLESVELVMLNSNQKYGFSSRKYFCKNYKWARLKGRTGVYLFPLDLPKTEAT